MRKVSNFIFIFLSAGQLISMRKCWGLHRAVLVYLSKILLYIKFVFTKVITCLVIVQYDETCTLHSLPCMSYLSLLPAAVLHLHNSQLSKWSHNFLLTINAGTRKYRTHFKLFKFLSRYQQNYEYMGLTKEVLQLSNCELLTRLNWVFLSWNSYIYYACIICPGGKWAKNFWTNEMRFIQL